jgi:hypothetical protein
VTFSVITGRLKMAPFDGGQAELKPPLKLTPSFPPCFPVDSGEEAGRGIAVAKSEGSVERQFGRLPGHELERTFELS